MSTVQLRHSVIIGGGATGSTIARIQAARYKELRAQNDRTPELLITVVEPREVVGPGLAYDQNLHWVFGTNQPIENMTANPLRPEELWQWAREYCKEGPAVTYADFLPRSVYGQFLADAFRKCEEDAVTYPGLQVMHVQARVTNWADIQSPGFRLKTDSQVSQQQHLLAPDSVVYAGGHRKSEFLSGLNEHERFLSDPYNIFDEVAPAVESAKQVAVVGTGAKFAEVLTALNWIGYEGQIYAFSRNLIKPWAFDPAQEKRIREEGRTYEAHYLVPEALEGEENVSEKWLGRLLRQEIQNAKGQDFTEAHAVVAVIRRLDDLTDAGLTKEKRMWLACRLGSVYGNATSPKQHNLMKRLEQEGRLHFIQSEISEETITPGQDGDFVIAAVSSERECSLSVGAVFNAANTARSIFDQSGEVACPVLRQAHEQGWLRLSKKFPGTLEAGEQNRPGFYVAGPVTEALKWGMETFSDDNLSTAQQAVEFALTR